MGDVAKKCDNGALFHVEDIEEAQQRFENKEIVYSGPIFGHKMKWPLQEGLGLEKAIFDSEEVDMSLYKANKVPGTRRSGIVYVDDINITEHPEGLQFEFFLPKGSYATVMMNLFIESGCHTHR